MRKWGYLSLGVGVACLGLGYYYNQEGLKEYNDSLKLYDEYKNATSDFNIKWRAYNDKYDSHRTKFTHRNVFYIISISTGIFGIYTIFFEKKPKKETTSIKIYPNQIVYSYNF